MAISTENIALASFGSRVALTTSEHPKHPSSNIIDGDVKTFWVSTGLFPQEITVSFANPAMISKIIIVSMKVGHLSVDSSSTELPVNFSTILDQVVEDTDGSLQTISISPKEAQVTRHLRLKINKGYAPFVSIHRLVVYGDHNIPAEMLH
ncbi:hypothetical protein BATDEDRAFT_84886 [Batrachochytrium dendrobatidis JAM81]|uniref:F5/8 type C domain-containing protein n=2 Tax=Batrachochytrium dendrobatidis TaxID=109871 RepID=F4NRH4_BATDJ|nr:uncharacterized protein BATDEDRAFT_84886 [Batrachochytrium dendrobatidis JAM81]EGF84159.1 hypothetical protein BATDEDRAFT_84886 [Batrachochytrium dendrobatidis JAM81]KAJ8326713.1 hypothetical protein O5D80_004166 [Batrachochytrium dendrobatidis]KAK5668483.1 hypothetical protein QVD99_005501 [Batrachochytrium dendrobatidis]OAJ36759.1 hypothetical protein BDEG_20896 [Batrachochytrium dendrobatidis JEL423]|eukprot:XP_006676354.1 hypothetical protein BATDEDRAFT_84886 [Batrachochytrium dendrobatidis JAM81]